MKVTSHMDERYCAIQQLQNIRSKHRPGSPRYERADYAISLALNGGREVNQYIVRNLLRDAERILTRSQKSRQYIYLDDSSSSGDETFIEDGPSRDVEDEFNLGQLVEAKELAFKLLKKLSRKNAYATRVFEGLINGESLQETSSAANISTAYVQRIKTLIRHEALELIVEGAA